MRKRKSPIVLVTALVVIVTGVAGLQYAWSRTNGPASAPEAPPEVADAKQVGDARPGQSATETSQSIKAAMASKPSGHAEPEGGPGGPGGPPRMGDGPMILNPARANGGKPEKPKPNTSSTSAQWYNNESAMSKDKG